MQAIMFDSRRITIWIEHRPRSGGFEWRTPPMRWRQWFVGGFLALPGAVGGLLVALALPVEIAPLLAISGAAIGLKVGFKMENK